MYWENFQLGKFHRNHFPSGWGKWTPIWVVILNERHNSGLGLIDSINLTSSYFTWTKLYFFYINIYIYINILSRNRFIVICPDICGLAYVVGNQLMAPLKKTDFNMTGCNRSCDLKSISSEDKVSQKERKFVFQASTTLPYELLVSGRVNAKVQYNVNMTIVCF